MVDCFLDYRFIKNYDSSFSRRGLCFYDGHEFPQSPPTNTIFETCMYVLKDAMFDWW